MWRFKNFVKRIPDNMSPSTNTETISLPKVILFGDSLTERSFYSKGSKGLGDILTRRYAGRATIENEGMSGYCSTWLLPHFDSLIQRVRQQAIQPPLLFTIWLGANDACPPEYSPHVPLDKFEANLRHFVDTILTEEKMSSTKVVLITPPPINLPASSEKDEFDLGPKAEQACADAAMEMKGYKIYVNKAVYAQKVMEIAKRYGNEVSDRVVGLDYWSAVVNFELKGQGLEPLDPDVPVDFEENGKKLPGSGLPGAKNFRDGMFTDGLHLGTLVRETFKESSPS